MVDYYVFENVRYYTINGTFMLGNNETSATDDPSKGVVNLFVPLKVNNIYVKEIGSRSFLESKFLSTVTIEARITQINNRAFGYCRYLERINIPNTCELILQYGVQTYDSDLGGYKSNPYKKLDVFFEPNSKIKYIDDHAFAYRLNINIYFCNKVQPSIHYYAFVVSPNVTIYSPYSFRFNNIRTTTRNFSTQCVLPHSCRVYNYLNSYNHIIYISYKIFVLLS